MRAGMCQKVYLATANIHRVENYVIVALRILGEMFLD